MKRKYFGTDGVRGVANGSLLTPEFVLALGRAAAKVLPNNPDGFVVIGRDSRISGPMLEAALCAGLISAGRKITTLGIVPTPAVSWITENTKADFGIVISASHNPVPDNGIKFFNTNGDKLADEIELGIEKELHNILHEQESNNRPIGYNLFLPDTNSALMEQYCRHLTDLLPVSLHKIKIVCDTAWGAAAPWAQQIFTAAGADTVVIHNQADGKNINVDCGSTNVTLLQKEVLKQQADLGLAFDGDADRLIAIDNCGRIVDGDGIMYILATHLKKQGLLTSSAVVGTVMSNMGLEKALHAEGIAFVRTKVGDRYVSEQMKKGNINLGGEQSGHIINTKWACTGDGMLNGLQLAAVIKQRNKSLSELGAGYEIYPQCLINVSVADKEVVMASSTLQNTKAQVERQLHDRGRVVLRPSGTQQMIRVMVEAESEELANSTAQRIADVVRTIAEE